MKYMAIIDDEFLSDFRVDVKCNSQHSDMVLVVNDMNMCTRGIPLEPLLPTQYGSRENDKMTIDEIMQELERTKDYPASDPASDEALDATIAIIHKYQKIEQIIKKWAVSEHPELTKVEYFDKIVELMNNMSEVENGNDISKNVKIGDEIYSSMTESKAVVYHIDAWHRYECFTDDGCSMKLDEHTFDKYWTRTGRNFPQIEAVLHLMKENNNDRTETTIKTD